MEEESSPRGGQEGGSKPPPKAPAFFVILHPSQGDGSKEGGILVANRDVSSVAPVITTGTNKSKFDYFLSSNCTSGEITVTLDNNNMWNEFYHCSTEMVLTKQGRRMFPYCRYWISGLNPHLKYILVMDITPLDNHRYKWNGKWWEPAGKADPHVLGRVFIHPESPSTGQYWMNQPVSFYKLKLTNNILDQDGHIILHSMHRYLPRLHVVPAEKASEVIQLNGPDVHTFTFPQTEFIAVTAYQNFQITQLKIDCNPFAKGFREGTVTGRPIKDWKHKPSEQEADSPSGKNVAENEESGCMSKLQELFKMSEYLDCDKENDAFGSRPEILKFIRSASELDNNAKQNEDVIKRLNLQSSLASLSEPAEQPSVKVKTEPEDDYDYSKSQTMAGVTIKQEPSDAEVTDDYSNSDVDYPILEKHFAKFKEDPYLDGKHFANSPTEVAQAKLMDLDQDIKPVVHPEPCAADNNDIEAPELHKPVLSEDTLQDTDVHSSTVCTESPPILPRPRNNPHVKDEVFVKERRKRICKNKIDEIYATLQTALRTPRGPKRKFPLLFSKASVTPTPGNEGTVAPIAKKRGRPPKPKIAKVGRPAKKDNPIEASRLFPDFNPDLEDVDGVLFVAFSSKEALDVHTGKKPTDAVSSPEASIELTDDMKKILGLEGQLLTHLKTMKYRQVIHPALQQVGLKLNIVDPAMSIDLRYLGVELPLPYITGDTRCDENDLCAQGLPFVSRTGKTTDYTKIKGWRDKFSTESATSSQKEAGRPESSVKNLSAFCSDELDEYLEKEAKLMGDFKELTQYEPESSISYQLPTKSSSYVRTLDSVLKKQAQHATSSFNVAEPLPVPRKKRKYTRRVPTIKSEPKPRPILPSPITVKEKASRLYFKIKKEPSESYFINDAIYTPSSSMEYLSKSQSSGRPSADEQSGTAERNLVEDNAMRSPQQVQIQSHHIVSKPVGLSKGQMKLIDLEEGAVREGKARTYITEERADISLSTLLTAQVSLKNRPILKLMSKRTNSCSNEFCRLGCICDSLSSAKRVATHCRHETCMFSSDCLKKSLSVGKDGIEVKASRTKADKVESDLSPFSGYDYQPIQAEVKKKEKHQEMSVGRVHDRPMKAKKRKFTEGDDTISDVRTSIRFPIWNRCDLADDPEPICIPEQAELVESKSLHKVHVEKVKSPGGGKPGRPSTVTQVHPEDPVYMYFDSMMTCARVRIYPHKAPKKKKMKAQSKCDSDTPVKEHDHKLRKAKGQEKESNEEGEVADKKCKTVDNNGPTKLIEMISDLGSEDDDGKAINITTQHVTSSEPQSLKLGSFNIELMQDNKNAEKSPSGTLRSRVKIAMSGEKQIRPSPAKQRPVKWKVENLKPPDEEPEDTSADIEAKSHGGKGLPFYTKVIPAGKLIARLKTSDINEAELIEVNGKKHPQAKLLLGQMGALHPANRLAAYITRRLQPSLFHLSKVNEANAKTATKSPPPDPTTEDKSKDILTSPQNKTAAQSRPSSMLTKFVLGEVGSMQKSPGVSSPEPTILGSPKMSTQSTRLLIVSSAVAAGKPAPAITTTSSSSSSMNVASSSTTSLSSSGSSTVSPSKVKATPPLPTLMRVTKLVTKGSSLSIPAGVVAAHDARTLTLTPVPSSKNTVLTPPVLVKSLAATGSTSSVSLSNNPGISKNIPASITNLLVSPNLPRVGSVASQVGLNIASPITVKTVTASTVSAKNPSGATSGFEKRLGPRLLLIPVNSASSPARPAQCVQTSPGQKMVLQPIKSANGVTLFRHPNGQIIQLVPLQQVNSANNPPSRQQVIIRNPGPVLGVRLPLPKSEAAAATSIPATSAPPTSAPATLPILSPSKTSANKSEVIIFPQNPPVLTLGAAAVKTSPSSSNYLASLSYPQAVTYNGSGQSVITSNVTLLQSGDLSLANAPLPSSLQNISPVNAATIPHLTLMGNKQVSDKTSSLLISGLIGEEDENEVTKERKAQSTSVIVIDDNEAEVQKSTEEVKSATQEINISAKEQCQNGREDNEQSGLSVDSIDEFLSSDVDLSQEDGTKDAQGLLAGEEQGPAGKADSLQSPAKEITSSQVKSGDSSPVNLVSTSVPEQESAEVEKNIPCEPGSKAAKSQGSEPSSTQDNSGSLQVDPHIKQAVSDSDDQQDLDTEDESEADESVDIESMEELSENVNDAESSTAGTLNKDKGGTKGKFYKGHKKGSKSEADEYVDIETVEEFSEEINLACLKASATNKDTSGTQGKISKGRKKSSKVNGDDMFLAEGDEEPTVFHRINHTANERKRRSELRDLFDELKNALSLQNLPKVSKSYILKQAIEEVEDLTDTADTLIKKKTLLSQTQSQLIKKVSNLSGKPREVVLKKLEYLYAKQKAMEAEKQKKNEEEEITPHKASMNLPLPKREPFLSLTLGEDSNETLSSKPKKPIILARKHLLLSKEGTQQQPGVPLITSNVLIASAGQVVMQDHTVPGQVAALPPTLIQADLSPAQMKSGLTSVVIQLPSTIELKGIIGNSPVPIAISTLPGNIAGATFSSPLSENDDLSMMPKIVNVTSLAQGAKPDLGGNFGSGMPDSETDIKADANSLSTESYARGNASVLDASYVTAESCVPSTSIPMDKMEEGLTDPVRKICSPYSNLLKSLPKENDSSDTKASSTPKNVSMSNVSIAKMVDLRDSGLELELKKLTSAIDEAGLEPSELSDTMGDPEDADETLTSLLDEIEFLNEQLNKDTDDLDSVSDFPGLETASRSSVSKFTDGDSSPFSFGRFKEGSETKEKNISFSSLFMQLEEGEIPDSIKPNEEASIVAFEGGAGKVPSVTNMVGTSGLHPPSAAASTPQKIDNPVTSCSDVFWRPMPKLAPLGLKTHTIPSDQRALANKSMPSLASVTMRLSSPKTTD